MTNSQLINYYADLLILQYVGKPKAYATIQTLVTPVVMDQLPVQVQDAFAIDTANGAQLDILGKYIGASRTGFNFSGPVTLSDTDYRTLLKIMIVRNALSCDQSSIQSFFNTYFPGVIDEFDHASMRLSYFYEAATGANTVAEFFIKMGQLPKPLGVQLSTLTYAYPVSNFFGMRTYNYAGVNISPFNTYSSYLSNRPWLSYQNGITI